MVDLDILQDYINIFATKHELILQKDIERIEFSDKFNREDYDNIDGKKFIDFLFNDYHNIFEIRLGKIKIEKESLEGEEYYSIEKNIEFEINIFEFSNIDDIMKEVYVKCILYNFID
jgi:hypothetical protein